MQNDDNSKIHEVRIIGANMLQDIPQRKETLNYRLKVVLRMAAM